MRFASVLFLAFWQLTAIPVVAVVTTTLVDAYQAMEQDHARAAAQLALTKLPPNTSVIYKTAWPLSGS